MQFLRHFTTGFLIGVANLIPGVSGGTFALILGVYERLITFLNQVHIRSIKQLLHLVRCYLTSGLNPPEGKQLVAYLRANDYHFMAVISLGAVVCILAMSSLMKFLLLHHFTNTYAYFFGLIILSVAIPWRMVKKPQLVLVLPLLAGVFLTVSVSGSVNPYDKALHKSTLLAEQYQQQHDDTQATTAEDRSLKPLSYIGKYSAGEYAYIFFCGIVAISAMVLPGVSGSLVLILLNQYFTVISALANIRALLLDDLFFLAAMSLGIALGLLSFARLIEFAFKRFHDITVSFLVGLIAGSLYALWPFKSIETIADYYVKEGPAISRIENYTIHTNVNILPHDLSTLVVATCFVLLGMGTMLLFLRWEKSD